MQRVLGAMLPPGSETGTGAPDVWRKPGAPHHWGQGPVACGGLKPNSVSAVGPKSGLVICEPRTSRSRRKVRLCTLAVAALRKLRVRQAPERLATGEAWNDHDLVFTNSIGRPCEVRNVT